jgi:hypothetical protein
MPSANVRTQNQRECLVLAHLPRGETKVLPEIVQPHPAAGLVETLFDVHDVPYVAVRHRACVFVAESLLAQPVGLQFQVCSQFFRRVRVVPMAALELC